jgi:hypothetical protein
MYATRPARKRTCRCSAAYSAARAPACPSNTPKYASRGLAPSFSEALRRAFHKTRNQMIANYCSRHAIRFSPCGVDGLKQSKITIEDLLLSTSRGGLSGTNRLRHTNVQTQVFVEIAVLCQTKKSPNVRFCRRVCACPKVVHYGMGVLHLISLAASPRRTRVKLPGPPYHTLVPLSLRR